MREKRRKERKPISAKVELNWTPPGGSLRTDLCECIEISETGLRGKLRERIPDGTVLFIRSAALALHGPAVIRHCVQKGIRYQIGIEFTAGMLWKPPAPIAE